MKPTNCSGAITASRGFTRKFNMKKLIPFLMAALVLPAMGANFSVVPNWAKVPTGEKQIGSMHGDVAVSSKGEVYVSVQG